MRKIGSFLLASILFIPSVGCFHSTPSTTVATSTVAPPAPDPESTIQVPDSVKALLDKDTTNQNHILRKFPYPYQAMLAISSDIDDTTPEEFVAYHRFLNTKEQTPVGQGLGLDISDSMWMYMGNNQEGKTDSEGHGLDHVMTYFVGTNPKQLHNANQIRYYFKAGWIDSIHTFGDFSRKNTNDVVFSRSLAEEAWKAMNESGIKPKVWINHGNEANKQNFGAYNPLLFSRYQAGDDPKSPYYHTDLTIKNGIKFVWNSTGQTTFGYDNPLFPIQLRDGQKVWGFNRYTHDKVNKVLDWTWNPRSLHRQITKERIEKLLQANQYSIVAQHFGGYNWGFPLSDADIAELRMVVTYEDQGKLLVARTSRLLTYALTQQYVHYAVVKENGKTWINIINIQDPIFGTQKPNLEDVRGLTFYTDDPEQTYILLDQVPVKSMFIQRNPPDSTGKKSISVKWFDPDYTDYSKTAP